MGGNLTERVIQEFQVMLEEVVSWIPTIVVGVVLAVLALATAFILERIARLLLVRIRLDGLATKAGITQLLQRVGIRRSLNDLLPRALYFVVLVLFVRTGAQALELVAISDAIGTLLDYLPNVLAAALILLLGGAAASYARSAVTDAARNAGMDYALSLGRATYAALLFVIGVMAIGQLRIDTEIIRWVTVCALAGLALAFGLSFGFGSRDITRNILAGFYARKIFEDGRVVEIRGERGVLVAITPTQTVLEQDQHLVSVANTVFLEEVVKQKM